MRSRAALLGAMGLMAMALALTSGRNRGFADPLDELEPGEPCAVVVGATHTTLDLPFDPSFRYVVVVGSLAPHGPHHTVVLSSEPCDEPAPLPVYRLAFPPRKRAAEPDGSDRSPPSKPSEPTPARVAEAGALVDAAPAKRAGEAAASRSFFIHVTDGDLGDPKQYVRVTATEIAAGRRVRIFLDDQQARERLARGLCDDLLRLCDDEVVPRIEAAIGPCRDVDGDGRFTILLTPWLNALQGGRTSLGGFVRATDFDPELPEPLSNHGDILYLNATLTPGPHLKTLVAHEFMHAACLSARLPAPGQPVGLPHEEDWISEGLAHLAENAWGAGWSNLDYRAAEYLDDPAKYPLVVPDYYRAGLWRCHGCRGATWLFLRWCADQSGPEFLAELSRARMTGAANIEALMGMRFAELFRRWSLAVAHSSGTLRPREADGYTSIALNGRLGTRQLTGPCVRRIDVDAGPQQVELAPTAVAFLELAATGGEGTRRVRIEAPPSARLQVTIIKSPCGPEPSSEPRRELDVAARTAR